MNRSRSWLLSPFLFALLTACASGPSGPGPGGTTPTPPTTVTAADAWGGPPPDGAAILTPEAFERDLQTGDLVIASPRATQAQRDEALAQYERDRAALAAIPADERSPDVQNLLDRAAGGVDPLAEGGVPVRQSDGTTQTFVLLSLADEARHIVETLAQAESPANALEAYTGAYEAAPDALRAGLPAPADLAGRSLAEIEAAQLRLDDALVAAPDPVRTESVAGALSVTPSPGGGSDGGTCTPGPNGLYSNFWWPLKRFVTPIRNQGSRGTCWAFAAVAALESRELVVNGATLNLSEQAYANRDKLEFKRQDWRDGGSSTGSLGRYVSNNAIVPAESAWTYNTAAGRNPKAFDSGVVGTPASYKGACSTYSGTCGEASHESPGACATFPLFGPVCAFVKARPSTAGGVASSNTTNLWHNQHASRSASVRRSHFPLATLRAYLNSGRTLLASFGIYRGFDNPDSNGFVTDYAKQDGRGGHAVLIVGFISNTAMSARLPNAPQGAGGGYFIVKNSWGCSADGGFFYIPVDYVTKFFNDLAVLKMPATRSQKWVNEVQGGGSGPAVQITRPAASTPGPFLPIHYVDFKAPLTFEASASDALDGPNCCASTFRWTSRRLGDLGSGRTVFANLSAFTDDVITVTARDRDGNSGQASLSLADAYPIVTITAPLPGQTVPTNQAVNFAATVGAYRGPDATPGPLDCSVLFWTSSVSGDGSGNGCAPAFTFRTPGPRTLTATYAVNGRNVTASVSVTAVAPTPSGPPSVSLQVVAVPTQRDTPSTRYFLRVRSAFTDPGGPGEADRGRYTFRWSYRVNGGPVVNVTPAATTAANEVLIDVGQFACDLHVFTVTLAITDPENLTGTGTTTYSLQLTPCIR